MATLNIRNLPDDVHVALRVRAARAGVSMEAEVRAILTEATRPAAPPQIQAEQLARWVDALYEGERPQGVVDELVAERRKAAARE